jgi:hypothetical protein
VFGHVRCCFRSRKQALEQQIRILSERANVVPGTVSSAMICSSSDFSLDSLLRNLRTHSNTGSVPSTSPSILTSKQHEDDHERFAQAVQAIVTTDESQSQSSTSSTSGIAMRDDDRSRRSSYDDSNAGRVLFDKYESHSSEDRDPSLEDLICRLVAAQQQQSFSYVDHSRAKTSSSIEPVSCS